MREITPQLSSLLKRHFGDSVPRGDAYRVSSYDELMRIVAELSYLNRDNLIFFRGQSEDHRNKAGATTLYPSIYRRNNLSKARLDYDFKVLKEISSLLSEETRKRDRRAADEILRKRYIQWSIIQHYQVYDTPLLDVTQSLRVACSFAQMGAGRAEDSPADRDQSAPRRASSEGWVFVYALALPYMPNGISINSEQDIVNVRLLSACPSLALRPYFQEGFLVGTTDITDNYGDKYELDFNRRLVAKFAIPRGEEFWGGTPGRIPKTLLFLDEDQDAMYKICSSLRGAIMKVEKTLFDASDFPEGSGELAEELRLRLTSI